jgi:hypothetical protein
MGIGRNYRSTGTPHRAASEPAGPIEGRLRQDRVADVDGAIEPLRERPLLAQAASPFAVIIRDTAQLPLRQFEVKQGKRCVGPCLSLKKGPYPARRSEGRRH